MASPKNVATYIEQRLSQLGLKARLVEESRDRTNQFGEAPGGEQAGEFNLIATEKLPENCSFIKYCQDTAATLSEPYWWSMVHNLVVFGEPGREKIHELSKPYPKYSEKETEQKIKEAQKAVGKEVSPHSCIFIEHDLGFACPEDCLAKKAGIKSPAGLAFRLATQEQYGAYLYKDKQGWKLNLPKLVEDLLADFSFQTLKDNEECLLYNDGVYKPTAESIIKEECERRVPRKFINIHHVNEIIAVSYTHLTLPTILLV